MKASQRKDKNASQSVKCEGTEDWRKQQKGECRQTPGDAKWDSRLSVTLKTVAVEDACQ